MGSRPQLNYERWEGVYTVDFTLDGLRRRCLQLAQTLVSHGWSCLVTHDTRFMAGQFARYVYRSLEACGVTVSFCPNPTPLPAVEFALMQKRADVALLLSAGNQPFWHNGLIVLAPSTSPRLLDEQPLPFTEVEPVIPFPTPQLDTSEQTQIDLRGPYLNSLREVIDVDLIQRASLTLFVDPMNGTTSGYIPGALGESGQTKAIEINRESDPLFGRQPPHPFEAGLNRLRKLVKESDSSLGIALSADGQALCITDNVGETISPLELALLLAQYLNRQHRQRGTIIAPPPPNISELATGLRAWEDAAGLKVTLSDQAAVQITELVHQDQSALLVGASSSGEITLGRYGVSPDATLAALFLIEIVARFGNKLRPLVDELRAKLKGEG